MFDQKKYQVNQPPEASRLNEPEVFYSWLPFADQFAKVDYNGIFACIWIRNEK
jgi:hypothetical protein